MPLTMPGPDSSQYRPPFVLRLWTPPDDPDKPPFPYMTGFTTRIHRHTAPPPFGPPDYGPDPRPLLPNQYMQTVPQSQLVVDNPLLETPSIQAVSDSAQLVIKTPISVGSARGAQVVSCSITTHGDTLGQTFQAVAKIYDALYYRFSESIAHEPRNVVSKADEDYSREAAAYEHLQATGQTSAGAFAPDYYGSWTFDLPIVSRGEAQTRPVRLILIEHLDGPTIRGSLIQNGPRGAGKDAFHYPLKYRLEVLALAMDGYVRQLHSGLNQMDFAGRNLVLIPARDQGGETVAAGLVLPRIVLIDYNIAVVYRLARTEWSSLMDCPRPCNPMLCFWDESVDDFGGWVPHEWHENPKFMQEWLQTRFGTEEKRKLYAPFEDEMVVTDYDLP